MEKNCNLQKGFTLVELSIVLVIIGLIISSVLVGQDLIRGAELRATVSQLESFNAAVGTFRGKYGGIPGDVSGATDFGFTGDGNGDGLLAATGTSGHAAGENVYFWNHLGSDSSGLISGSYDGTQITASAADTALALPANKSGERWGVYAASGLNYFIVGATTPGTDSYQTTADFLTPLDAKNLDDKIDDGRPGRGIARAHDGHASAANTAPDTDNVAGDQCVSAATSAGTYTTTNGGVSCTMAFRFNL